MYGVFNKEYHGLSSLLGLTKKELTEMASNSVGATTMLDGAYCESKAQSKLDNCIAVNLDGDENEVPYMVFFINGATTEIVYLV